MTVLYSPSPGPPTSITIGGDFKVNLSMSLRVRAACAEKGVSMVKVRANTNAKEMDFLVATFVKNCTLTPFLKPKEVHSRTQMWKYESELSLITYCIFC